ncbi:MAG TPA: FliM/FliN family flagellar motor switch protein [Bryobacteraceae bacterium]|nr:FliM/FliN family flagellar motor switch protein [Bryobacteraceae bacterium]
MSRPDQEMDQSTQSADKPMESVAPEASVKPVGLPAAPLLMGVKLPIRVLMGRTQLPLRDIARLGGGSVVELDCSPDSPVDILVNDRVIAQGEIVVVGGNYGVRITRIASAGQSSGERKPEADLLGLSERLK